VVAGGVAWAITGEAWAFPISVAAGVLVDIDHGPDLVWNFTRGGEPVATLALHAWEWVAGLVLLGIWTGFSWWLIAVLLGYGPHVITDHTSNRGKRWTYSLLYRARHKFQVAKLAPGWRFEYSYRILEKELPPLARLIERWRDRQLARNRSN
jgi:hypothetical protein